MANRRYNTQVAQPRGADRVKRAGGGMGGRSGPMMYSRGQGVNMRSKRVPTELMDRSAMKKGGKAKGKHGYKKEGGKKGLSPKLEGAERLAAKKKQYRDMGFGDMMDKGELVIGREFGQMKNGGRALKPVPAGKKGLSKLPTQVRNKMGFMKDGGKVKDKTKPKKPLSGMKKPKPGSQSYQFLQTTKPRPSQIETKKAKGGRVNTKRMNRLEELGRVDAEKGRTRKGKRNLRDEKKRIVRELKKK